MKNADVLNMNDVLSMLQKMNGLEFSKPEFRTKFSYALAANKKRIATHLETLGETKKADPKWVEYDGKRLDLCKKLAEKGKDGEPLMDDIGNFKGLVDNKEFNAGIKLLREEYKDNLHEGDIPVEFYKIKEAWLPMSANFLGAFVEILFDLVEWDAK